MASYQVHRKLLLLLFSYCYATDGEDRVQSHILSAVSDGVRCDKVGKG